ncbi:cupin domain-containing protein [Methylobacterium terricola]|uniref:cupin domain-containing protein n=1 Tax=Methylobacterium terricola TaxID=2583531 RepID=UPI00197BE9D3|nr:cupin domain-containing protein [Methylobacterium terricola]
MTISRTRSAAIIFAATSALLGSFGMTMADDMHGMTLVPGEEAVRWSPAPPSLPRGSEISILYGDPNKPGPFTLRVRFPADTLVAPHTHAADESVTLLSGSLMHAMGETVDKTRGKPMKQGGFVFLPAKMPHSLWTSTEPATVQVSGVGPFGLIYVEPADDPARQSSPSNIHRLDSIEDQMRVPPGVTVLSI